MAHHIYQTEGFVIGSSISGEANKDLDIFTRDLGLVRIRAQGIRKLQSKLRYSLQEFSLSTVLLVRGRELWRLTTASLVKDFYHELTLPKEKALLARIALLLRRLLNGEEKNEALFTLVIEGLDFVHTGLNEEELKSFETLLAIRMLNELGYWGRDEQFSCFVENSEWSRELLTELIALRSKAVALINASLRESQL